MNDTNSTTSKKAIAFNKIQHSTKKLPPRLNIELVNERKVGSNKKSNDMSKSNKAISSPRTIPSSPTQLNSSLTKVINRSIFYIAILILASLGSIYVMLDSLLHYQRDVPGCQTSYMRPQFIKQTGFDSEMTRFASKYGLYLYREKGVDYSDQPTGTPVLFIPGHAGSYKQVRSLAAESAFYYYKHYARDSEKWENGYRNLDFFTVDFNEEFSALHGQSLLDQAEYLNDAIDYILKLYPQAHRYNEDNLKLPDPTSVIIIGHSMGGIAARTMFTISNYQHGTINTVITMSTPHMLPPVSFDWKISQLYDDINQFWKDGFSHQYTQEELHIYPPPPHVSLRDISIVSIAGGTLDTTVCSDSTNIGSIVPETHGFTVFSTAIPHVWTGADHVSILTCNQLVKVVAKTLLALVDVRRGTQTKPLDERMSIMRRAFLSSFDTLSLGNWSFFNTETWHTLQPGEKLVLGKQDGVNTYMLPTVANADAFALLSDQPWNEEEGRFQIKLCAATNSRRVVCRAIHELAIPVPASTTDDQYPFSGNTFSFATFDFKQMGEFSFLAVFDEGKSRSGFLVIEPYQKATSMQVIHQSMLSIAVEGVHVKIGSGLFTFIRIPSMESPILAYHLKVSRPHCLTTHFAPFLRQSISSMHESKFYVNLGENSKTEISIHGRAAFASDGPREDGLTLQVWMDPMCAEPLQLDLSVDWYGSAGRLGFRNGVMLATFSFVTVILVFTAQLKMYNDTGIYPHFGQGLSFCLQKTFPVIMLCVGMISVFQCLSPSSYYLWYITFVISVSSWQDVLAGNTDSFFWWIPLAGFLISVGVVSLLWLLVEGSVRLLAQVTVLFTKYYPMNGPWLRQQETKQQQNQRRAITTVLLFVLVATFIPYQFVFVVAFLVQIVTCVRDAVRTNIPQSSKLVTRRLNRYNYTLSLLLLLFTLLPFNLPILLVWIRNISVQWFVPFSSDHNVFAIAPFIIYVEILTSSERMLPRQSNRFWKTGTYLIMYYIVMYAFFFGIKYTHWIYFLSNYLVSWFMLLHYIDSHYGKLSYHYLMDSIGLGTKKHS